MEPTRTKLSENVPPQALQEARLRAGSFNSMDGDVVADALMANRALWDSFVFGNFASIGNAKSYGASGMLLELRDLPEGVLNADTLLILSDKARWPALEKVLESPGLEVNEVGYTAADDETFGCAPFRTAEEVGTAMGGGFYVKNVDESAIRRHVAPGSPLGRKGPRVNKTPQAAPENIPILIRVWWD